MLRLVHLPHGSTATSSGVKGRVLVVDDDPSICETLAKELPGLGFSVSWRTSAKEALLALEAEPFDVVLSDLHMEGMDGLALCEHVAGSYPEVPFILITAYGSMQTAIQAIRAGAYDFINKPLELEMLGIALRRAVQHRSLREEVRRLRSAAAQAEGFEELLGQSLAMRQVYDVLDRSAGSDSTVLILGESGTGKELAARAVHRRSPRHHGPWVVLNCAAVPEHLLESELFGHVRGAFTDARADRKGLFPQAQGGTLFLDEIGELPPSVQPKLLRALQERLIRPVGSDREYEVDVRIVAASNRDLEAEVSAGRFRQDLYYRINVISITLPPLRARGHDVLMLAQHFVEKYAKRSGKSVDGISPEAAERLLGYDWPGNVRELENCIERAIALTRCNQVMLDDLADKIREHRNTKVLLEANEPTDLVSLEEIERRYILRVMHAVGGNKRLAAQILKLDRSTLYRKLERYLG